MKITVSTRSKSDWINITRKVQSAVAEAGIRHGWCLVYVPHTTAGVTINESADPAVADDIQSTLDRLIPNRADYRHLEGNSAAHVKTSLIGSSVTIPIDNGQLQLGTWQGIFFCDFDGPRTRKAVISFLPNG